jgi:hypothetical protein
MFLEVEGCCGRVIIRGKDGFIVSKGSYDSGGVLRNVLVSCLSTRHSLAL